MKWDSTAGANRLPVRSTYDFMIMGRWSVDIVVDDFGRATQLVPYTRSCLNY